MDSQRRLYKDATNLNILGSHLFHVGHRHRQLLLDQAWTFALS